MANISAKQKAFQQALKTVNSSIKNLENPVNLLGSMKEVNVEKISTGSLILDGILGGGVPKGRIIEIYGPEASGKTSIALTMVANIQKQGGNAVFLDVEQAFDPKYAKILGVDTANLGFSQSTIAEEVLNLVNKLILTNEIDIIVVDSVASLVPSAEYNEDGFEKATIGLIARLMSKALKQISANANKHNCIVVFLNQIRDNVGELYGSKTATTGGKALKFYASQRIEVKRKGKVEEDGNVIGNEVFLKCIKNKVAPPFGEGITVLTYKKGINKAAEVFVLGEQLGTIQKEGRTYYCINNDNVDLTNGNAVVVENRIKIGNSSKNALTEIEKNTSLYEHIANITIEELNRRNGLSEDIVYDEEENKEFLDELDIEEE